LLDRLALKIRDFLDRFLFEDWLADTEQARRARLIARFGFLGLGFGMLYAAFYLLVGHYWGAGIILFCSAGFGSVPWMMRRTRNLKLAGNTLAAIMTVGFAALCCVEGGLRGHAVAWLASVPLCALLLVGKESARFWVYTCFAIGTGLVAAEIKGISLPVTYDVSWNPLLTSAGYLGLIVFMFVLGLIFETGRERAFAGMQKALSELASSNDQLVILNKEKSEFLGIAAHDLRNPLSTIVTFAQALERSDDPADVPTVCSAIQSAGTQMRDLIVNLLDSNALEEGRFQASVERCELNVLVARSVAHNQLSATRKDSVIVIGPSPQLWARADQLTTVQILDNLISNAVKYSPPNSSVLVQVSTENDEVLVAVKDEGPGISDDDQTKLFRKFMRLTARPTAGESSTGLGLSIVKKLAEAMSGSVECQSVFGQGATFIVRLPAWDCGTS
jgi:signal transduction histidine kinase